MSSNNILLSIKDQIAFVTINRPGKLNVLNTKTITELFQIFKKLKQNEEVKAIIINGSGEEAFVAGADVSEVIKHDDISGKIFSTRGQKVFRFIQKMPKPVIAAINGYAYGAGCELALFCHIRLAAENAQFSQPEINLGLIPGYGATQQLSRLIGTPRALYLLLTGNPISANKALEIGLVNEVLPAKQLMPRAIELANHFVNSSSITIKSILQATIDGTDMNIDAGLNLEAELFGNLCISEDSKEGIEAFINKRQPKFNKK